MPAQTYLTKTITASSSNTLGVFSSAATTLYTSGVSFSVGTASGAVSTPLDTGRRIIFWSSVVDMSGLVITVNGLNDGGNTIRETVVGSCAAGVPRATTQDFARVTSLSFSSQNPINGPIHVGTNTQAGTLWQVTDLYRNPFNLSVALTINSTLSATLSNFEVTLDDITQTDPALPRTLSTASSISVPFVPQSFIPQVAGSTYISTLAGSTTPYALGNLTAACAAWRVTLTSSSSTAGSVFATGVQAGV